MIRGTAYLRGKDSIGREFVVYGVDFSAKGKLHEYRRKLVSYNDEETVSVLDTIAIKFSGGYAPAKFIVFKVKSNVPVSDLVGPNAKEKVDFSVEEIISFGVR